MKGKVAKAAAKGMKNVLDTILCTEANSTSCIVLYQSKAPKELMKYRRTK
ncbi:MAG: cyclic lactone autoinducer peptide [Blautia sp.]|nr:cyclic lactone autoinducer peptide [Blautia sp.]